MTLPPITSSPPVGGASRHEGGVRTSSAPAEKGKAPATLPQDTVSVSDAARLVSAQGEPLQDASYTEDEARAAAENLMKIFHNETSLRLGGDLTSF